MHLTLFANALTTVPNSFFFFFFRLQIYALMVLSETSEIILKDTFFFFSFKRYLFKFKRGGKSKLFTLKCCLLSWQSDSNS